LPRASAENPILWIVAGPNGSGKSSVYQDADIEAFARSVWIINPDLLTARIQQVEGLALSEPPSGRADYGVAESFASRASDGGRRDGAFNRQVPSIGPRCEALRFEVRLTYVILDSPERNVERVKMRVAKGGHAVARDKIISRYARSLEQLPWFLEQASQASI
jgi:predicted ABC-type ATPase